MTRLARLAALLGAACTIPSCAQSGEPTELVILVRSDLRVPDQIDAVDVSVIAPSGRIFNTRADRPDFSGPVGISLRHAGGPLGPLEISAVGRLSESAVVTVRAQTSFLEGESRVLVLRLSGACMGVLCADGETCTNGTCRSALVDPATLPRWTGSPPPDTDAGVPAGIDGGPPPMTDGGTTDAGRVDAGRVDAGRPRDAGRVPDAGPCVCDPPMVCCSGECGPPGCDDSNPCTDDYCSPTGCEHASAPAGRTCSDGVFCNGVETCSMAVCLPGTTACGGAMCDEATDRCTLCDPMVMGCTLNDTCATALDITGGGTFSGTTCGASDDITFSCGAAGMMGTPDLLFVIRAPGGMRSWTLDPSPGFPITDVRAADCTPGGMVCSDGSLTANASGTVTIYFALERAAGGCGDFTLNVVPR